MVLYINIFKCLAFAGIQMLDDFAPNKFNKRKKEKRTHHRFAEQIQKGAITKVFSPLHPPASSLAETMSLHYLAVILPP